MTPSLLDLPDDILVDLFSRYVSANDLGRLQQVCRRFYGLLYGNALPWKKALTRLTNVSLSQLKNAAGCPELENACRRPTTISHPFHLPSDYLYQTLYDRPTDRPPLLSTGYHRPSARINPCPKADCDTNRVFRNYSYLYPLARRWNSTADYVCHTPVKFARRAQTSLLQYDDHEHHLWFSTDCTLHCLNISTNQIEHSYEFNHDDVLCYKVYNEHLLVQANGNVLRIICRQTGDAYSCQDSQLLSTFAGERNDILSLDVYSSDRDRYVVLHGSRDHTVSVRTFDLSSRINQKAWRTKVDDRVLCTRFTSDGQHFLVGTGGNANVYPLVLFDTEKAQPVHVYNAKYRHGAGVRCIEWISSNVFIAAGFDTQFKEFDVRTGTCHYTFYDDYGNDYSSLAASVDYDNVSNAIVLGCNHHSVRLVNRTQRQEQKVFFVSDEHSPVHSLAVTSEYLFASLDRSIVALDFTKSNGQFSRMKHRF